MKYSNLYNIITYLEYGTKLHISVLFFGNFGNELFALPHNNTIHSSPVCSKMKTLPNGFRRCFKCRNTAIHKALSEKKSFGGMCINGIYEYLKPITIDDTVVCIIFIGNILPEESKCQRLKKSLCKNEYLIESLEKNFSPEKCSIVAEIIESYILTTSKLFPKNICNDNFDPLIENLKNYINANLEYKTDILQLAKIFHYNEKYLGRLFKKKVGISINQYINNQRTTYGKELLKNTDDSIINIASKIGFGSVTYFNRLFKQRYKMTPTEYRQKQTF